MCKYAKFKNRKNFKIKSCDIHKTVMAPIISWGQLNIQQQLWFYGASFTRSSDHCFEHPNKRRPCDYDELLLSGRPKRYHVENRLYPKTWISEKFKQQKFSRLSFSKKFLVHFLYKLWALVQTLQHW